MVIKKSKMSKTDSKQTAGVTSSLSTSSTVTGDGSVIVTTQKAPIVEEKLSSVVTKSSSSTKVSSSSTSQEQNFFSTTSSSSSSQAFKSGKMQQLQSSSDAFLRGERTVADIDAKSSRNGAVLLDSGNLRNVSSDFTTRSNLDNLVSIEIESKDARAASARNEQVTNTVSKSIGDGNRNDAITVESGRKSGETTMSSTAVKESSSSSVVQGSSSIIKGSSSLIQDSSSATSSSTHQEFSSSSSKATSGIDSKESKATASKNVASSKTIKNGQVVDNKNVADTTTTFTSKVFDDKTKSWVVVEQSSVNETDIMLPAIERASSSSNKATISSSTASGIDSTNTKIDSLSTNSKSSNVQMSSKSTKETLEKNTSSKKESSRDEKIVSTTSNETVQVYDNKTKSWKNVDVSSLNQQKRPSYVRYRSQNDDGSWHTIYKRKLYDEFSKQWRIVEEKVVSSDDTTGSVVIPQMIENSANTTTTTYTTKVYDTKTGKWSIVEEKSFTDTEPVNVTQDIRRDFEIDQADLANIITTTETTKVRKKNAVRMCIKDFMFVR